MKRLPLPKPDSRSYSLLQAMIAGPGTFYQIAERAGFDIEEAGMESRLSMIFSLGIQAPPRRHHVRAQGSLPLRAAGHPDGAGWPSSRTTLPRRGGRDACRGRPPASCGGAPMKAFDLFSCAGDFSTGATMVGRNIASWLKEQA